MSAANVQVSQTKEMYGGRRAFEPGLESVQQQQAAQRAPTGRIIVTDILKRTHLPIEPHPAELTDTRSHGDHEAGLEEVRDP